MTLSEANKIFYDNLPEIKEAIADNMLYNLSQLEKPELTGNENLDWVKQEVYKLKVQAVTEQPTRVIKRIISCIEHKENKHKNLGRITEDDIVRAREYPIEEMFEGQLNNGGAGRKVGRCPFHNGGNERTPSFYIFKDNRYKCFGCQIYGDAIEFYMKQNDCNFIQAVKALK